MAACANFRPMLGAVNTILRSCSTTPAIKTQGMVLATTPSRTYAAVQAPVSKPEGRTTCTLVPGDGVGPEMMAAMQEVIKASGAPVDFEPFFLSDIQSVMSCSLEDVVNSVTKNAVCLKGILASPTKGELSSVNFRFRSNLDLFANVVHIKSIPGINTRHKNVDLVVVREQSEGEFSALEHETVKGVIECYKIVTEKNSRRIAKFAFDYAVKHNRRKVTAVHKANIMKLGDGLFLRCCQDIAQLYPAIQFDSMIIDNCTMQMASNPHQFDVLVMGNLYGSILDNIGSGLVGGAGVVAGSSYSPNAVVFEPGARHTYAEAVGKNIANPTAYLIMAAQMLNHVNLQYHGAIIFKALLKVIKGGKHTTKDLGGQASTDEFTYAVIAELEQK